MLLLFCGNQVEQAKSQAATLRFVGLAVDEAGMAVDKIVDHMSGIATCATCHCTVAYHRVVTAWRY